jgi:hypothetical protein
MHDRYVAFANLAFGVQLTLKAGPPCQWSGASAIMIESTEKILSDGSKSDVVEFSIRTLIPRRFLKVDSTGTEYYVSPSGDDNHPGTRDRPFRHIQRCADIAQPGDTCFVRKGTYRETVRPKNGGRTRPPSSRWPIQVSKSPIWWAAVHFEAAFDCCQTRPVSI